MKAASAFLNVLNQAHSFIDGGVDKNLFNYIHAMKTMLLFFLLLGITASAQSFTPYQRDYIFSKALQPLADSTGKSWRKSTPGIELQKASRAFYIGSFAASVGTTLVVINPDDKKIRGISIGLNIIGGLMLLKSFGHINRAGILLEERKIGITASNGIGIRYSFR
jgi:hypothetical protein